MSITRVLLMSACVRENCASAQVMGGIVRELSGQFFHLLET
jgi:hypothetical protein